MLHPHMTAELVRQRRAALEAPSRNQRLVRHLQPRARTDPERGRFAPTAQTLARQVRSQSLEVLPGGTWRVMATLTTHRALELVELHLEIEPAPSDPDWLVLRGRAVLDRAAFGGKRASILGPQVRLELAVRARKLSRSPWRRTPQPRASRHRVGAHAGVFERLQELLLDELGVRGVRSAPVRVVADARIDQRWRAAGQVVR